MKRRKSNGRGANGEARTHELLERIAREISSMRKEIKEIKAEIRGTNERIDTTNDRIDHLIDILAPKLKDHDDRLARLERGRAA